MERFIAIDGGKFGTKSARMIKDDTVVTDMFRTKIMVNPQIVPTTEGSYLVEYEGDRYIVGDNAESMSYETSKKLLIHKICLLTAIANIVDCADEVILAVGCPLSEFFNETSRKEYAKYIAPIGEHKIKVDGSVKYFKIKKVDVYPESIGIAYLNIPRFKDDAIGVIDIGGLNVNGCVYNKLAPVASTIFTANLGSNVLTVNVQNALKTEFGVNPKDYEMESILRKGFIKTAPEESREVIARVKREHIENILAECKKQQWELATLDIAFTGGTSLYLKNEIMSIFPYINTDNFSEDAPFLNVKGFLKMLLMTNKR